MKRIEKAGIMRIVSDMVKADAIIDIREINCLETIKKKYKIEKKDEMFSDKITLSEAIKVLKKCPKSLQHDICGDLKEIAMSDDICSKEEAMLFIAVNFCLSSVTHASNIYSIVLPENVKIDNSQILYVESEYSNEINRDIFSRYREISNELKLIDLNFVYIPKIIEHYTKLDKEQINSIISFLYPSISETRVEIVKNQLVTLTTSDFCKDKIADTMGIKEMSFALPSFMFRIGNSFSGSKNYDNFLIVPIDDDPYLTTKYIVDNFVSMFKPRILNSVFEGKNRFVYNGFYKMVFDNFVYRKGIRSRVVVDIIHKEIILPEADLKLSNLHRREKALYTLFLLESASGGINFNQPNGSKQFERYKHRMASVQRKYEIIYENFGGDNANVPQIELPEIRLPMISLIKKQIRQFEDILNNPNDYLIQRNHFGNYCVALPPELCLCYDSKTSSICRFQDSEFWSKLSSL